MSTHRPRIDRDAAERLLDGAGRAQAGAEPLPTLLAAAAAPAQPGELAGWQAAAAVFRAHRAPVRQPRRRFMLKIALAKLLTVKAAAVAALAVGGGGVALAASTGVLPNPLSAASGTPTSAHASGQPTHSAGPHGSPSPSLEGLCKAYSAMPSDKSGKALESPAFQALITAAGGQDKVTDFCKTLLPSAKPTRPGGGAPSAKPSAPPAGASTAPSASRPAPTPTPSHH